jgi:hypothetical protein
MAARAAVVLAALALLALDAPAARSPDGIPLLADAHVFLDSDSQRSFDASGCALPCGWMATDALGNFVAEGTIAADRAVHLPPPDFPVGFYRIAFSRPGTNATTAAVLREPIDDDWPPSETPVAVDTAQSWLQPCDMPTQTLISLLAAAAGCGWSRDRLRWSDIEPSRGHCAPPVSTCYDNATRAARAAGVRVLDVFHATPAWAINAQTDASDDCDAAGTNMPRDLRDIHAFTRYLTERFGAAPDDASGSGVPLISAFEPWNEGNIAAFGGQTTDQRDSHQKAAYLGFRSGDGTAPFVCNNVIAGAGSNLTRTMSDKNDVSISMDSYNIHTYDPVERYTSEFAAARQFAHAVQKPLWLTECGIHLPAATAAPWSDMTAADDLRQAQFIGPSFAVSFFAGVKRHFFFVLSNYLERGLQYGLLRQDRTPRPGYSALAAVGFFLANASALGKLPSSNGTAEAPKAEVYAMRARPGGGASRDVLMAYCPPAATQQQVGQASCALPSTLQSAAVSQVAKAFDFLGRDLQAIPSNVTAACVFIVLPDGAVGTMLRVSPPPDTAATDATTTTTTTTTTTAAGMTGTADGSRLRPSSVVLQATFPYHGNEISANVDAHSLNASGENSIPLYAYNFGQHARAMTVRAEASPGTVVKPASWALQVPAGGRTRFVAKIAPPGGRAVVDGDQQSGGVTITAESDAPRSGGRRNSDEASPTLFFRVLPNLATLQPAVRTPCAGRADPSAWSHNVPAGASVQIQVASPSWAHEAGCIHFDFNFPASVKDAWAYPQLSFNGSDAPPAGADGVRYTLQMPPSASLNGQNVIWFDKDDAQFSAHTSANASDGSPQQMTVLFKDALWDHQGPAPADPTATIEAGRVGKMAVGLNLVKMKSGAVAQMTVCDLEWIRF